VAVSIKLPAQLRAAANGQSETSASGGTVREVLDGLCTEHPELRDRLLDDGSELRRFVNVFLRGEDIRFLSGMETPVADGDELTILPAVAGGAH
jgi:MoaD family protein